MALKDEEIAEEKQRWRIPGGCAALAAVFLLGRLYVANAGDCRALLVSGRRRRQLSRDHTPDAERTRLQQLVPLRRLLLLRGARTGPFPGLHPAGAPREAVHASGVQPPPHEAGLEEEGPLPRLVHGRMVAPLLALTLSSLEQASHFRAVKTVRETDIKPPLVSDGMRKVGHIYDEW